METILITGGSGLIGQKLSQLLIKKKYSVRHLSRTVHGNEKYPTFKWDIQNQQLDKKAIENVSHIIHLAGAGVAENRWTKARKEQILMSRTASIQLLYDHLKADQIKTFISASGVNYYGTKTTDKIFKESDASGDDFLASITLSWERKTFAMLAKADRVVALRTGVVLSEKDGALEKLKQPIKWGIGSALGTGKQYMPWIHIEDLCQLYITAIENDNYEGVYNAVSSEHTTNLEMTKTIAAILGKKLWAPKVPSFVLKLLLGEMSEIILEGSRIDNSKVKAQGFKFRFDSLNTALRDVLGD